MKLQISSQHQKQNNLFSKFLSRISPFIIFHIEEKSMMPLLFPNNSILVSKISRFQQGDIVVLKNPNKNTNKKYLVKQIEQIKSDSVYVIGINKKESIDSRHFGWIAKKNIVGKMMMKL